MELLPMIQTIEGSGAGEWMRTSLTALPVINALHVMALAVVFGTIFIVDLRLLGFPDTKRSYRLTSHELLRWTWAAFAVAAITGLLMFAANATTYVNNTAFWLKMGALVLAGINMAVFQFLTVRGAGKWDTGPTPPAARLAGLISIALWTSVIFFGRWIGFTKGYDFGVPEDLDLDFDFDFSALEPAFALLPGSLL